MKTRKLSQAEFAATRRSAKEGTPLDSKRVTDSPPPEGFWEYVQAIPAADFEMFDCREGQVTHVYRMGDEYEHVLINSQYQGVAMVIVVDLHAAQVYGHHLLDINPPGTRLPED